MSNSDRLHAYFKKVVRALGSSRPFPAGTPAETVRALRALGLTVECPNKYTGNCERQLCPMCNGYFYREVI